MKKSNLKNKIKPLEIKDGKLSEKYLDTVGVIVVALDTKGKITFLNKKGCEILGYKKSEIIGKNWFDTCLPKNQKKQIKKVFKKIITGKGKQLKKYENFIITKKGEVKLVSWFNTNFVNDNVKIIGTLSSGEDITDQKKTEEMLLKSQRKISDIVEFFPDAVLAVNKEKEIIIWNKAIEKMSGIPASKMIGKGNYAYTIPFYGERRPQLMDLVFKKNKKLSAKYKNIVRIGNTLTAEVFCNALYHNKSAWLSVKASPLHDESGNVIGAIESLRDITERKITEEVLKNQNLLINGISDNLDSAMIYQAIILKDGSRKFTYLSNSVKKFYGVSPENGMKNSNLLYSKFHKDDIKGLINAEEKAIRDFSTFRYEARVNDSLGNIRWSSFVSKPKKLEDGTICFDGIEFDISKIKKTEEKLKQSEERFHLLFENANDAI